jgi:tRNA(fMet)-specific endonuclease VapC
MYCPDTNICLYALNHLYPALDKRLQTLVPADIAIPAIVEAEMLVGFEKGAKRITRSQWEAFVAPFSVLPFNSVAAKIYAQIRGFLEKRGEIIGPNDLIIAATIIAHNAILITHNVNEFRRVPGLQVVDWTL